MILKSCMFILQSRGYGKTYYEIKKKQELEKKNLKVKEIRKYEKS